MHRRGNTHLGPSVHNIKEVASRVGLPDGLQHLLILQATGAEARQGLAAPADGGLWGEATAAQPHQAADQLHPPPPRKTLRTATTTKATHPHSPLYLRPWLVKVSVLSRNRSWHLSNSKNHYMGKQCKKLL